MFRNGIIAIFILLLTFLGSFQYKTDDLRFVAVLYRHGDRTPTKTYPKDPYKNVFQYWPEGMGELTNLGIRHQYKLGRWFRNRYDGFLPQKYSPDDVYVRASDRDRTLMSAGANLAGLYPPKNSQVWNKQLLWQPIPIHTVPSQDDQVVGMKKPCARYDLLYDELLRSPFFQNINRKSKPLYDFLSENTGWNITQVRQIESLYSLLSVEKEYNLTLPDWTTSVFPKKLEYLAVLSHASFSFTRPLARLITGPFFNYLFKHFDNVISNTTQLKFLMISAHDNTIVNILSAMGVYDYTCPDFASSIIWELKQVQQKYYVTMFYKNKGTLVQLKLFGCDIKCGYSSFKTILEPVTVDSSEWIKECTT